MSPRWPNISVYEVTAVLALQCCNLIFLIHVFLLHVGETLSAVISQCRGGVLFSIRDVCFEYQQEAGYPDRNFCSLLRKVLLCYLRQAFYMATPTSHCIIRNILHTAHCFNQFNWEGHVKSVTRAELTRSLAERSGFESQQTQGFLSSPSHVGRTETHPGSHSTGTGYSFCGTKAAKARS